MKNKWYKLNNHILLIIMFLLFSCGDDDSKKEWGNALIYMPQAALRDGGITNVYPVPFVTNPTSTNHKVEADKNLLHVYLSVYRSGLQPLESFSVQIAVDAAATVTAAASTTNGIAMPDGAYTLPAQITVPKGEREAIFYLTVDMNKLDEDFSSNRIVLVVGISNPSKYELNEKLCKTTVVIDGSVFLK